MVNGEMLVGLLSQPIYVFLAVLARLSPPLMLAPPFRTNSVPMRVRALIAIAIAASLSATVYPSARPMPPDLLNMALSLAGEALLGLLLGSIIVLAITSLQLAGQSIGHLAGFDIASNFDPATDEQMPVISNLLGYLAMIILLLLGGHRELMKCCLESFQRYPAGGVVPEAQWLAEYEMLLRHTFVVGLRAAAPLATALLLANILTGLLARTLPQLNVLAIGFNINALALLILLVLSMGSVGWIFQQELAAWIAGCQQVVAADV
jgi:flagellar biosynthesis protein FliR